MRCVESKRTHLQNTHRATSNRSSLFHPCHRETMSSECDPPSTVKAQLIISRTVYKSNLLHCLETTHSNGPPKMVYNINQDEVDVATQRYYPCSGFWDWMEVNQSQCSSPKSTTLFHSSSSAPSSSSTCTPSSFASLFSPFSHSSPSFSLFFFIPNQTIIAILHAAGLLSTNALDS